ncbi:hypothetical protein NQ176_g1258 [Zarea fungicola]|uniref:Uncharacterized protein n=1 Tax=Zarea fungicola TaxID=93591 RepID=A0ACC1NW27_9HYPO|nr:hypothetical protein NQ176_g1258 [Lecanicillium fungicola]
MMDSRSSIESEEGIGSQLLASTKAEHSAPSKRRLRPASFWLDVLPWTLCAVLFGLNIFNITRPAKCYWHENELEIARKELLPNHVRTRFTGGLRYNSSKALIRQIEPGQPDYVGFPSPEIDAAWHRLISTTDVYLTDNEMRENLRNEGTFSDLPEGDRLYTDPFSGLYQAVPSVFHDLHCLNKIRRAIYIDHYPEDLNDIYWPHIQHCLDTIRQSLMCTGDLTPIPEAFTPYKPDGSLEPIFQVFHSCRDYEAIQKWAKTRDALDDNVWRSNAERLKPGSTKSGHA